MFLIHKYFGLVTKSFVGGCIYLMVLDFQRQRYVVMWLVVHKYSPSQPEEWESVGSWLDVRKASAPPAAHSCLVPDLKHSLHAPSLLSSRSWGFPAPGPCAPPSCLFRVLSSNYSVLSALVAHWDHLFTLNITDGWVPPGHSNIIFWETWPGLQDSPVLPR